MSSRRWRLSLRPSHAPQRVCCNLPRLRARLAPICTAVPSRPTEAPPRCDRSVPTSTRGAMREGTRPWKSMTSSITSRFPPSAAAPKHW